MEESRSVERAKTDSEMGEETKQAFAVVTDSAASIPRQMQEQYGVSVVPIWIQVSDRTYREREDISTEEFYGMMQGEQIPCTSSPPPGEFVKVYRQLAARFKEILSIHITAKASATYQAAKMAAESIHEAKVTVYDSGTVSMGTGFMVLEAAKAALGGLKVEEIIPKLDAIKDRVHAFVAIPTLQYLRKSGRVSQGQSILGSILSVKLVLELKDGILRVVDKVRRYPRALERVVELASSAVGGAPSRVAVMHANCPDEALRLCERVRERINVKELVVGDVGAALAVHGGPGMTGIILYPV